jgi:hypothetical protein
VATVARTMTDPDPATDHDGGADATDSAGAGPDAADGRDSGAGTGRRATPRLADAPDGDADSAGAGADDADTTDRSVADPGALREPEPIEPESLRVENALFVLLGALGTVALLATAIVPGVL